MKNLPAILLLLLLLAGCNKELVFETRSYLKKTTIPCPEQCPQIKVDVPVATEGAAADSINAKIFSTVAGILNFGEKPSAAKTYDELLRSFIAAYEKMQREAPDELIGWEGDIEGRILYQSDAVLNIEIKHYTFTGGAHGYSGLRSLLFDPETGKSIPVSALFNDVAGFTRFAERQFREENKIPEGVPINSAGLMFEKEKFHLPQNIFFTHDGILLYYNAYEIASFAEGAKELLLPYEKVDKYLVIK
ncbi:MAG TPA: DUF3298 domain-containing protein [Flavobacterium sp.]|jgi:hypothetical protein